jgi:hypothetical protein
VCRVKVNSILYLLNTRLLKIKISIQLVLGLCWLRWDSGKICFTNLVFVKYKIGANLIFVKYKISAKLVFRKDKIHFSN